MDDNSIKIFNDLISSTLNKKDSIINSASNNITSQLNTIKNNLNKNIDPIKMLSTVNSLISAINLNNTIIDPMTATPVNILNSECCNDEFTSILHKIPEIQNLTELYTSAINLFEIMKSVSTTVTDNKQNLNSLSDYVCSIPISTLSADVTLQQNIIASGSEFISNINESVLTLFPEVSGFYDIASDLNNPYTCDCLPISSINIENNLFIKTSLDNINLFNNSKNNLNDTLNTANSAINTLTTETLNKIEI